MQANTKRSQVDREVGHRVRLRRLQVGMTQTTLGRELGVTFQQVQKYEKGTNRISAGRLKLVAEVLKVPMTFFFDPLQGVAKENQPIFGFLNSAYTLRLVQAFSKIKDHKLQLAVLALIEQAAGDR